MHCFLELLKIIHSFSNSVLSYQISHVSKSLYLLIFILIVDNVVDSSHWLSISFAAVWIFLNLTQILLRSFTICHDKTIVIVTMGGNKVI